jgi:hypothetical protein
MSLLLMMGGSDTPSIGSLFASGEAGLALDVETAYRRGWVYQDSAGATVSAAAGDPVGLILDTAKGGLDSLGSDLVSNGTFATDTVWSKGANWTIGSGVATKTGGAANNLTQTITSTAGLWYRITMDVTRTAGELTVSLGTSGTTRVINASGSYTFFILAGSSTQTLTLAGDSAFAGTVDNVTARLVPGNHAYQTTSESRPALARTPDGGRRNVLTFSEQFDDAAWTKSNATVTANTHAAFDGTTTADTLTDSEDWEFGFVQQDYYFLVVPYTFSVDVRKTVGALTSYPGLLIGPREIYQIIDTTNGSIVAFPEQAGQTCTIRSLDANWWRVTVDFTPSSPGPGRVAIYPAISEDGTNPYFAAVGSVICSRAYLELGSSETAYQKVVTDSDVTESSKRDCWGLRFDGSDDSLVTASIDFSATDKMTVMAGVRKNSDAVRGTIVEHGDSWQTVNGSFAIEAPAASGLNDYRLVSKGTSSNSQQPTTYTAPITNVITLQGNISAPSLIGRINGTQVVSSTASQGTGNYTSQVILIGRRTSSNLPFNGLIYTLIIRGATTPTGAIADFERNLLAKRAGISW